MCGIFGYSGKNPVDPLRLAWLAVENQSRGEDSTGVFSPGGGLFKDAVSARNFVCEPEFHNTILNEHTIIGHARKATMGAKNKANAHPFQFFLSEKDTEPALVGTHNGQIFEYYLEKICKENGFEKPDVDSEIIFKMMLKNNFDYDEALSNIEGAMALAFIRPLEFPDVLYLYRRQSRPLHVGFIGGDMYYSSEAEPLHLIGCEAIDALDTDKLYIFRKGGLVEVSPVKKSLITSIKEDQGIQTWLQQTATEKEKAVVGVFGAHVRKLENAETQKTLFSTVENGGRDTGDTTKSPNGGWKNRFSTGFNTTTKLLPLLTQGREIYSIEALKSPSHGKFYNSGNYNSAYILLKLVCAHDPSVDLPAWLVRVKGSPEILTLTAHNGLGVLDIPKIKCGDIQLNIINPIQPEVIYTVNLSDIKEARVWEVTLQIPFLQKKEKDKGSEGIPETTSEHNSNTERGEGYANSIFNFPKKLEIAKAYLESIDRVQSQCNEKIQEGAEGGFSEIESVSRTLHSGVFSSDGEEQEDYLVAYTTEKSQLLYPEYDETTDCLKDMDVYTVNCNIDETEELITKVDKSLSSIEGDADKGDKQLLYRVKSYLEYINGYFKANGNHKASKERVSSEQ